MRRELFEIHFTPHTKKDGRTDGLTGFLKSWSVSQQRCPRQASVAPAQKQRQNTTQLNSHATVVEIGVAILCHQQSAFIGTLDSALASRDVAFHAYLDRVPH